MGPGPRARPKPWGLPSDSPGFARSLRERGPCHRDVQRVPMSWLGAVDFGYSGFREGSWKLLQDPHGHDDQSECFEGRSCPPIRANAVGQGRTTAHWRMWWGELFPPFAHASPCFCGPKENFTCTCSSVHMRVTSCSPPAGW